MIDLTNCKSLIITFEDIIFIIRKIYTISIEKLYREGERERERIKRNDIGRN